MQQMGPLRLGQKGPHSFHLFLSDHLLRVLGCCVRSGLPALRKTRLPGEPTVVRWPAALAEASRTRDTTARCVGKDTFW